MKNNKDTHMPFNNWIQMQSEPFTLKALFKQKNPTLFSNEGRSFIYECNGFLQSRYTIFEKQEIFCEATIKEGCVFNGSRFSDLGTFSYLIIKGIKGTFETVLGTVSIRKQNLLFCNTYDIHLKNEKVGEIDIRTNKTIYSSIIPMPFVCFLSIVFWDFQTHLQD